MDWHAKAPTIGQKAQVQIPPQQVRRIWNILVISVKVIMEILEYCKKGHWFSVVCSSGFHITERVQRLWRMHKSLNIILPGLESINYKERLEKLGSFIWRLEAERRSERNL